MATTSWWVKINISSQYITCTFTREKVCATLGHSHSHPQLRLFQDRIMKWQTPDSSCWVTGCREHKGSCKFKFVCTSNSLDVQNFPAVREEIGSHDCSYIQPKSLVFSQILNSLVSETIWPIVIIILVIKSLTRILSTYTNTSGWQGWWKIMSSVTYASFGQNGIKTVYS